MPQLNPKPWFAILMFSWACFLVILPPKVTGHIFTNTTKARTLRQKHKNSWPWVWN
nr:ATP synthase F0 subunit 8 [Sebastapistes fowleri]